MSRIACLEVPLFPLAARLRAEPELEGVALAVTEGTGSTARIVAASRAARRLGVRAGMTLAQARALVPKLVARARDAAAERAASTALTEIAARFSPRIELAPDPCSGVVFLDVEAPRISEAELGRELARAARREGLPAGVGIAASKLAAQVAARSANGETPQIVATGEEAAFLAPLPLARLAPELELARTIDRWGLSSIGDFARLPAAEVSSRLGAAGARLHAVARGADPRPLLAREPPPDLSEGLELEWPLVTLEPFLFVAYAALERLCRRLETRAVGCARLALELDLEPAGRDARAWELPAPTRDAKTLLTLLRLDLEARPPGAAVVGFAVTAIPGQTRSGQGTLFGTPAISPERLATTLARLFALLGGERVGSPRPIDGHRPERFVLAPYTPPPPPLVPPLMTRGHELDSGDRSDGSRPRRGAQGLLAVRTLRPPVELEVQVEPRQSDQEKAPTVLRSRARESDGRHLEIAGSVRVASGPWHLEESWWNERAIEREYWDVELDAAGLYRIYRELAGDRWFADGIYD